MKCLTAHELLDELKKVGATKAETLMALHECLKRHRISYDRFFVLAAQIGFPFSKLDEEIVFGEREEALARCHSRLYEDAPKA